MDNRLNMRRVLGWKPDGQQAALGIENENGEELTLVIGREALVSLITNGLSALAAFPTPKVSDQAVVAIAPSWIDVSTNGDNVLLTFHLAHGGSLTFVQDRASIQRVSATLSETISGSENAIGPASMKPN